MAMQTMTISLPNEMRDYVDTRTQSGGFGNTSEYVRDLIRRDRDRREQEALEQQLIANLGSPQTEWTAEVRERMLAAVESRIAKRRSR
jgi:antitoxin ParD1/3/4